MKSLNTVSKLINFARSTAGKSPVAETKMAPDREIYDIFNEALLEERTWLFAYAITTDLTLTKPTTDLGYKYAYVVDVQDIEDVLDVNPQSSRIDIDRVGRRRAVDFGIVAPIITERGPQGADFIYVNGVLHTDQEVTKVIYKRIPVPTAMTAEYKLLLAYKIAYHFSLTPGADIERRQLIKSEITNLHVRAARADITPSSDPQTQELIAYFRSNRKEAYSRSS